MFVRNAWYIAAWAHEVAAQPFARRICNEAIVLFRDSDGKIAALADRCPHRATPLSLGKVVANGIQCGYHGVVVARDGHCAEIPGQDVVPDKIRVKTYPVVEKDEFVWIWIGDADRADTAQIIDYPFHNDYANWPHKHDVYHVKADYMLVIDNLMDLTHLGYVHTKTIGGNPATHVAAQMKTTPTPNGLHFIRWMLDSAPPATYTKAVPFRGNVDRWQEFEFIAPGNIIQWSGAKDVGAGAYEGNRNGGFSLRLFHGLTPETDTTCFYFWSAANGYRQSEPKATEDLFSEIGFTFMEDKQIIEEQQLRLSEYGEDDLTPIVADVARLHMRRVVGRLANEA